MDSITNILTRKSIRAYEDKPISEADMKTILTAAMSGPSCVNARDWQFIVVQDRKILCKIADANGRPAEPLRKAAAGVLVCGDLDKAFQGGPEYWVIDHSIACQNLILAARALGIGSVWLGTWPQMRRVNNLIELFDLPDNIIPGSVIALGYTEEAKETNEKDSYDENVVHWNKW